MAASAAGAVGSAASAGAAVAAAAAGGGAPPPRPAEAPLPNWGGDPPVQLIALEGGEGEQGGAPGAAGARGGGAAGAGADPPGPQRPRLVIREEARKAVMDVAGRRPVRAVAVCGLYRSGKSLLLNLLAGTQGAVAKGSFAVGDTVRACTAGIWVRCSKPTGSDGGVCLLLDCEGTGNTQRDREHDARFFALAVLLSSLLILNSRGVINDPAVQALAMASSLAQHIFQQHRDVPTGVRLAPAFVWVLRDFTLLLEDTTGQPLTEREYLEKTLTAFAAGTRPPPEAANATRWEDQREARQQIMDLFPRRDCVTLVRPVAEEEQLQRLGELPPSAFRPKFLAQVEELRRKVFATCQALQAPTGQTATGGAFLALAEMHVETINQGGVPEVASAWQSVSRQECGRAVDEGLRTFAAATLELVSSLPVAAGELQEALDRSAAAAKERFAEVALGDAEARREYEADLELALEGKASGLRRENEAAAARQNEVWLQREAGQRTEALLAARRPVHEAGRLSAEACEHVEIQLKAAFSELQVAYALNAVGPEGPARDGLFERLAGRRREAALAEVAAWRRRAEARAEAEAAGGEAVQKERKALEAKGQALNGRLDQEVTLADASLDASQVGLREEAASKQAPSAGAAGARGRARQGSAGADGAAGARAVGEAAAKPKCCALQ